jgi:hypothetical protein
MSEFLSFFGVIALWIGVSYGAWWIHQRVTGAGYRRREALARQAAMKVAEAPGIFRDIRSDGAVGDLTQATHALLRRIQKHGGYFDDVNALRPRIAAVIGEECQPLAEILHIRRDLWAASEIVLIEDFRTLGSDFDQDEYDTLRAEAVSLLFRDAAMRSGEEDLIDLRLSMALEEARKFVADIEEGNRLAREHERLPTVSEVAAYPVAAVRAVPGQVRALLAQFAAFRSQVGAVALAIQNSETMARSLSGLARAREELPQRIVTGLEKASSTLERASTTAREAGATTLERASTTARQGAASAKGHYDFLVRAYDFQARYESALRKAPELTERGKQFIARLELAEKSERLKLTSATVRAAMKRGLVRGLAHMIALLQRAQLALEAQLEKQGIGSKDAEGIAEGRAPKANARRSAWSSARASPEDIPLRQPTHPASRKALGTGAAPTGRSGRPLPALALSESPAEPPQEVPAKRAFVIPEGIKPAAFDSVLAWYKPAVSSLAEKKGVVDTAVVAAMPSLAAPKPVASEPERVEPVKKKGLLRRLFGGSKPEKAPEKPAPAKPKLQDPPSKPAPAKPAASKATPAKVTAVKAVPAPTKSEARPSIKPLEPAKKPAKLSLPAEPTPSSAPPVAETPPARAEKKRRTWFGRGGEAGTAAATPSKSAESEKAAVRQEPKPAKPAKPTEKPAPNPAPAEPATLPASIAPAAEKAALKLDEGRRSRLFGRGRSTSATADEGPEKPLAAPPALSIAPSATAAESPASPLGALTPGGVRPAEAQPGSGAPAKLALSSRLSEKASEVPADETDPTDEPELLVTEPEEDDRGELTRSILESRARREEKPEERPQNRAFPWLRR